MTTFTILDTAACGKKIDKIARVGKALQSEIHLVAVSTLAHIRDHGDYTLATRLLGALPNGQRVKALANWYRHFSGNAVSFSYDTTNSCWKAKLAKERTIEQFNVDGAAATTFADLLPEKGYSTLTVAALAAMFKRKANEDGLNADGSPKVSPAARSLMADLYVKIKKTLDESKSEEPTIDLEDLLKA